MAGLVNNKFREEILYREALDKDDTIVKTPHGTEDAVSRRGCFGGS
jgi:hypothetical protein